MYPCQTTAVFIRVARPARGVQVPTLRRPQDGRKWSAGKFKDMSAHQREEAQNGGFGPEFPYSNISKSGYATLSITCPFLADWVLKNFKEKVFERIFHTFEIRFFIHDDGRTRHSSHKNARSPVTVRLF